MSPTKQSWVSVAALATVSLASPASAAQAQTITISSEFKPIFFDGKLQGCAINFEVARKDPEYSQGHIVYITGSLNFYAFKDKNLSFVLKLGVRGVNGATAFSAPSEAILVTGNGTNRADFLQAVPGEIAGFRMFMFRAGKSTLSAALESLTEQQTLTFAYSMRPRGMNAIVPVNLRMRQLNFDHPENSQIDDSLIQGWLGCQSDIAEAGLRGP